MSLATRCTHCNTIFKVVQDQLKVSEGWVRCGRCSEVFNALSGLFDMEREGPPQRTESPAAPAPLVSTSDDPASTFAPHEHVGHGATTDGSPLTSSGAPSTPDDRLDTMAEPTREAVTNFELELPPSEEAFATAMAAARAPVESPPAHRLRKPEPEPASEPESDPLPVTDESDALESRYLLPTDDERRPPRRRRRGPEFADARFPNDVMADAEGWEQSWTEPGGWEMTPVPSASGSADTAGATSVADTEPLRGEADVTPAGHRQDAGDADDTAPTTLPSRFAEDFRPEQPLLPPSQRKGRPGTRGRDPLQPEAPAFIKQAERRAVWRHPAMMVTLGMLSLAMALLLSLQLVHHFRDQIAARYPESTPWLAEWCSLASCELSPPMQLTDLQVDNIALVKTTSEGADSYRLTAIIHNEADIALAWPHVDLTLTDTNGEVVARRAFNVRDARRVLPTDSPSGASSKRPVTGEVPGAVPANSSSTLQWEMRAPNLRLAGYTAELFYP